MLISIPIVIILHSLNSARTARACRSWLHCFAVPRFMRNVEISFADIYSIALLYFDGVNTPQVRISVRHCCCAAAAAAGVFRYMAWPIDLISRIATVLYVTR